MISIQTNVNSLVAQQNLNVNSAFQSKTIAQLTSGYRINQSGDDAAGLAIANKYRSSVSELTQGVANGNDGVAQLQIMDGGMSNISQILDRLKTLATQSASGTITDPSARQTLNAEFQTDLAEIDRQAQSIGLNTGGSFAKNLDVYLGAGSGSTSLQNGVVTVGLTQSAVDSQALGLKGMQVVAGSADIGSGSAAHSVAQIINNQANATSTAGYTSFDFSGPGFADNAKIAVAVNLSGVSDISTLVSNINSAINSQANSTLPGATAFKAAGITASVSTDANGGQELSFSSSTSAFQVQAGDQMANALMGNLASGSTGTAVTTTVTGGVTAAGNTAFANGPVTVQISGASMSAPVSITFGASDTNVSLAINDLKTQVQNSAALQKAGISVSGSPGGPLVFTSATGETFSVQSTGDVSNTLGLGNLNTSALNSPAFYSTIQAGTALATAATGSGFTNLGVSLDGGPTGESGPTIAGSALTSVNTTGMGGTALQLNIDGTAINVNFANDPNKSTIESVADVVNYINSTIDTAKGWSSDVKVASVNSSNGITLADTVANANSTMTVTGNATSLALGLTPAASGTVTGTTAQAAQIGGAAIVSHATNGGGNILNLVVNGSSVAVNFANDANVGANESTANIVNYINNEVNRQMGWGSDVKIASNNGTGISLTDPFANSSSTLQVTANAFSAGLGLTADALTNASKTGTGPVGNTVTVNMAGGDATAATFTGGAALTTGVNTGAAGNTLTFSIDGSAPIAANFANDANVATVASYTGGSIAGNSVDAKTAAVFTGGGFAANVDAQSAATYTGSAVGTMNASGLATDLTLNITDAAGVNQDFTVHDVGANETATTVAQAINDAWQAIAGESGNVASVVNGNQITLASQGVGAGSQVQVTDNTASEMFGLTNAGTNVAVNGTDNLSALGLTVTDSTGADKVFTVTLTGAGLSASAIASQINSAWQALPGESGDIADGSTGKLILTSQGLGASAQVAVTGSTASKALNLTPTTNGTTTLNGTALSNLQMTVTDTTGTDHIMDFALTGQGQTAAQIATQINSVWHTYAGEASNNIADGSTGSLVISSFGTGAAAQVHVVNNTASQALNLTTVGQGDVTKDGVNETAAQVAQFLNAAAQKALGTSTAATFFSVNNNNQLVLTSQTKGADSNVSVTAGAGAVAAFATSLGLGGGVDQDGTAPTMASIVNTLNQAFTANTTLQQAGLQASTADGTHLTVSSSNGTNFRLDEYGSTPGTSLGFGSTNGAFTGLTSGVSKASSIDAGGTSAIGTTASGYLSFAPLQFGSDAQAVTITANSSAGALQALTLTLKNDSTAQNGATVDSAVSYINSQLQQSNNPTLRSIVAVKENAGGTEKINFLSSLPSFTVSVGSSPNGNGINAGVAKQFSSVMNGSASNIAIDTQSGAQAAIAALGNAVTALGAAQAAVGKGENQLGYAINLAQSQITNFSAAESQIRDANVAQQAANLSKAQVLTQASIAAMAQANSAPQAVLTLLRG